MNAFGKTTPTDGAFKFRTTCLDERLYGHELVVAAANNNAVENISRELPRTNVIDYGMLSAHEDNWYFPEVAEHYFNNNDECWGMFSAALGSQENNRKFFNKFWNKKDKSSMRYLLEKWTFHDEEFKELVKEKVFKEGEEDTWRGGCFRDLERKILPKWEKEKKTFKNLLTRFKTLQGKYNDLEGFFIRVADLDSQTVKLNEDLASNREGEQNCILLVSDLDKKHDQIQGELKCLEEQSEKTKESFLMYDEYKNIESELICAEEKLEIKKTKVHSLEKNVIKLKRKLVLAVQIVKDLEKEKQDYIQIKPNLFFRVFFFDSKRVKSWRQCYSKLVANLSNKRAEGREFQDKFLKLTDQLEGKKLSYIKFKDILNKKKAAFKKREKAFYSAGGEVELERLSREILECDQNLSKKRVSSKELCSKRSAAKESLLSIQNNLKALADKISDLKRAKTMVLGKIASIHSDHFADREGNYPNSAYWKQSNADLQQSSPWISKQIQEVRAQLFWSAIRLHKYFIILARKPLRLNITALMCLLNNKLPEKHHGDIRALWASLFMVVPVVSSTFASVQRLFRHLKQEEIGWLLIDEAGQAPVHYAVGAIWRSRRVIAVGDPLQVEPIVTLPKILSKKLYEYHHVQPIYDVTVQSVQTLADISNPLGTFIGEEDEKIWVGAPLIVHRRCMEPMFSVANKIAYNGLMIQATKPSSSSISQYFNQSLWISPSKALANDPDSHWIEAEGNIACYIIGALIKRLKTIPSIYVITPFVSVRHGLLEYIKQNHFEKWLPLLSKAEAKVLYSKLHEMIGTIHAFQGKQADAVILLLGGNVRKRGAIAWASGKPNILNVAITRAKKLLYVIGSIKSWGDQPHFSELSDSMTVVYDGDGFKKKCFSKEDIYVIAVPQGEDISSAHNVKVKDEARDKSIHIVSEDTV